MADFKVGLCGCFSNLSLCCMANCMVPLTVGKIAESIGESQPVLWAMAAGVAPCCAVGLLRTKIRERDGIEGGFCADCCTVLLFDVCAVNQLAVHTGVWEPLMPKEQAMKGRVTPDS